MPTARRQYRRRESACRASEGDPAYEIKSSKTDHISMHKVRALTKTSA
jgi:hypothetical protein